MPPRWSAKGLERLLEEAGARHTLGHVAPTPETVPLLGARFWPPGAHLLSVGDHELGDFTPGLLVGE
ncbi:hypothetical protein ACFWY5_06310 [Nonomuraea sp. NPDC059007]|uniref:hypothetical protein n=1 Tax=Nonomuraea sp. NPDC059007 TaxID=3346692 RepID=UPI00368EDDAC